jgi:uncharacterized protein YfaS (alpha-2-macroglobulin family)
MDYSRFDIDGVVASRIKAVQAFVFTERGVYRPGDTVHGGFIVRRRDWQPVLEGLPLAITLTDSQARVVATQKSRLPYDGFFASDVVLPDGAALGTYQLSVDVLDSAAKPMFRLGRAALRVEEFQPDRMKVATTLEPAPPAGWLACKAAAAVVSVQSLFGEAAPQRRVTMRVELSPADFGFPQWPDFTFYLGTNETSESSAGRSIDLGEANTNDQGKATFQLPFDNLKDATFRAAILTEAFERDGGRSVRSATTCRGSEVCGQRRRRDRATQHLPERAARQPSSDKRHHRLVPHRHVRVRVPGRPLRSRKIRQQAATLVLLWHAGDGGYRHLLHPVPPFPRTRQEFRH